MFNLGVVMSLSFLKRIEKGDSHKQLSIHAFKRAFLMLLLGWGLYCIDPGEIVLRLQNVLAQLASTFVFASGGWALISLAICYWLIAVRKHQKECCFCCSRYESSIYLFAHIGGANLIHKIFLPFSNNLFGSTGELGTQIILSCIVLFMLWYICYWMYKKKIFIRI